MNNFEYYRLLEGKRVLVTGGTGSIGSRLVKKILSYNPEVVRVYSRDETKQLNLELELGSPPNLRNLIGDIRDTARLGRALEGVDIVFHTAALKHVPACEYNPFEAVKTNVLGTQNVIDMSIAKGVKLVVGISTDKVVNPINVLGTTKLMSEKLLVAANLITGKHTTRFSCVRFGNVTGARGSVIPIFLEQLCHSGPLTVTDPEMTRFIMSIDEAVDLILKASVFTSGGEVFIFSMPAVRLIDVAEVIRERFREVAGKKVEIAVTGIRPGEKLHEELIFAHEIPRSYRRDKLLIILPEHRVTSSNISYKEEKTLTTPITSKDLPPLTGAEILKLVRSVDRKNILKWEEKPVG